MWFPIILLAGVAVVTGALDHEHAWERGNEYEYLVQSRTVTGLDKLKRQYTGLHIKAKLTVYVKSPEKLQMVLSNPQYAHLHTTLVDGPDTELPDNMLEYREIPMSGKPLEVTVKHGVIRDLLVDRNIPIWELNLLKSLLSQLQIDTQGENAIEMRSAQVPVDENSPVVFTAIEDSVGGKCEVLYEILPLDSDAHREIPDKIPFPDLRGEGYYYDVKKMRNYEKCLQRQMYHDLEDPMVREREEFYKHDKFISELSTTRMLLSGHLKRFTIQSVVTKNHISVRPEKTRPFLGNVHSIIRMTLIKKDKVSSPTFDLFESSNLESTGSLIYTYNNPFSDSENPMLPSVSMNSEQIYSSERTSSSEKRDDQNSFSSSSSDEDHTLYKSNLSPKRLAMHMASMHKKNPLLSFMTVTNEQINLIHDLVHEMAATIQFSNDTRLSVMEQYVYLRNFLRIMSLKQIGELEERLHHRMHADHKNVVWSIFRDAVAQTGTEPALVTVYNWLKTRKVEGIEAARIISNAARYVHEPTKEYVRTFYEMISDPSVLYQTAVNVTAPIAFAEVIRKNYANTYYMTRSLRRLGPMTLRHKVSPEHIEINDVYIPFMEEQLKQGLFESDTSKIQVYIMALGLTGNSKVLSIFEPYIEGKESVSKFHRLLMVSSLATLSKFEPKLVGPIFYKLYSNVNEDHKIRCMSIHRYIILDPPLIMLQRIAKFTNDDSNEDVISAVKSTINSLANTKRPELQDLSTKARSVRHLLNPKEFKRWNSQGYYTDLDYMSIKGLSVQTISSSGIIPSYLQVAVNSIFDSHGLPTVEAGYLVSSAKQLWRHWENEETSHELLKKSRIEKLMQVLQLKSEDLSKLEGHAFINTAHDLLIYPFNSSTVKKISSQLKDFFKRDQQVDLLSFYNTEMMLSFPIESGLPLLYTVDSPMIFKLKAEMRNDELSNKKKTGVLNMYVANKVQEQFGFIAPFERHHYIAGAHVNRMLRLPLEYELEYDLTQRKHDTGALKIRPQTQTSPITVLHLSTVPFTTRQDLRDVQPVSLSRNTHLVLTERKRKTIAERDLISVRVETDNKEIEENVEENNSILQVLLKLREIPDGQYKRMDIIMNPEQLAKSALHINVIHEKIAIDNAVQSHEPESQIMFPLKHVKPNSEKRRQEIVTGFSKSFTSGDVHVVDVNFNLPELEKQNVFTVGWMDSNVDKKSKIYLYWNSQISRKERPTSELYYTLYYTHEMQYSPDTPLNFEHMKKHAPRDKFKAELHYGESSRENKIVVNGSLSRSNQIKDILESSRVVKQCREEMERGYNTLRACQQATELARVKNQLDVSVRGSIINYVEKVVHKILDYLSHLFPHSDVKVTDSEDSDRNVFNIKMILSPIETVPSASLDSSQVDVTFPNMEQTDSEMQELLKENTVYRRKERRASCTVDKDMVFTFDKLLYPVKLGTYKHVLTTTYPRKDPDTRKNITEVDFVALIRNRTDGTKVVALWLDDHVIELEKTSDDITVKVDGAPVHIPQYKSYQLRKDDETIEFNKLPDDSIEVISSKSDIRGLFDGERIQLLVSDRYRNALRGLCGNYDSDPSTDFLTPQNCLMKMPEIFTATYALTDEGYRHEDILENKRKAEFTQCRELPTFRSNNVINDIEAGRSPTHSKFWGYHNNNLKRKYHLNHDSKRSHLERKDLSDGSDVVYRTRVVSEDEEICFTTKPVPMCREGTKSQRSYARDVDLYCQPKNEESLLIKRRIEQGANPDFTRKPISRSRTFHIPGFCE
ncbi:PREDICTED: vitellogenin-2-like isoform X2 [Trachymyrmex septentrionalis]|uniref:vitellogenin-2-like isoform X2 n=1 Tax=Trachymyrmex septentrionalis TaxID=34720 RepID=UPI00084F6C71|nr:PREDICTED: vitellogenin-2-like isoform X2 [Trachymyrmex septentrionalis]